MAYTLASALGFDAAQTAEHKAKHDTRLRNLEISARSGDYEAAQAYAVRLGEILGAVLLDRIKTEITGFSRLDPKTTLDILSPALQKCSDMTADLCVEVQNAVNRAADIGLRALRPAANAQRVANMADKIASYENPADGLWLLGEPVINVLQHVVDEAVRINAEAQAKAGLAPVVRRITDSAECDFCKSHAGKFMPPLSNEIFRRHERCRCLILLEPRKAAAANRSEISTSSDRAARITRVLEAEKRLR